MTNYYTDVKSNIIYSAIYSVQITNDFESNMSLITQFSLCIHITAIIY